MSMTYPVWFMWQLFLWGCLQALHARLSLFFLLGFRLVHFNLNPSTKRTSWLVISSLSCNVSCVTDSAHFETYYMLLISQSCCRESVVIRNATSVPFQSPWVRLCSCIVWEEGKKNPKASASLKSDNKEELIFHAFFLLPPSISPHYCFSEL